MKKRPILKRYLLASGGISVIVAATVGGVVGYTKNTSPFSPNQSQSLAERTNPQFSTINPVPFFVAPTNEDPMAIMNEDGTMVKMVGDDWNILIPYDDVDAEEMTYKAFYKMYQSQFNEETPVQIITAGPTKFKNYYVDAVSPKEFYDYAKWFMKNVAWGPDIATLKSFNLKKNVVQNGNVITLGQHQNLNKEDAEITFYPDSFFGSLPLYSTLSGQAQAGDKLLFKMNKEFLRTNQVNTFLSNTLKINTFSNLRLPQGESRLTFRNLSFANLIKKEKVFVYYDHYAINGFGQEAILLNASSQAKAQEQLKAYDSSITFDDQRLFETSISDLSAETNQDDLLIKNQRVLTVKLDNDFLPSVKVADLGIDKLTLNNLKVLEELQNQKLASFVNFRDFANITQYNGDEVFYYQASDGDRIFKNEKDAVDTLGVNFIEANLHKYTLEDLAVQNKILTFNLVDKTQEAAPPSENAEESAPSEESPKALPKIGFSIRAEGESAHSLDLLDDLQRAVGYVRTFNPYLVRSEEEKIEDGKTVKEFSIYTQVYDGLIERVQRRFPQLLKKLNGEHIVRKINQDGVFEYSIENGDYEGLNLSDRLPFLYLLHATDPTFKGVGTDFLRYVGTHEYGHHTTLQNISDVGEDGAPLLGGISTRGGLNSQSFYNEDVLRLYLKARSSTLDFELKSIRRKGPGSYPVFTYKDKTGKVVEETDKSIFGSVNPDDVYEALNNEDRRFLKTFDGLKEVAKKRGLKLYDLFLLNSIDVNSGTLNPGINGDAEYFAYDEQAKRFRFIKQSNENASKFLKDAQGNPITFVGGTAQVVEFQKDDAKKVERVLIFKENGDPVVNLKKGDTISSVVQSQIDAIQSTIRELVQTRYSNNGWNGSSTSLSASPTFVFPTSGPNRFFGNSKEWLDNYLLKSHNAEEDAYLTLTPFLSLTPPPDIREIRKFANISSAFGPGTNQQFAVSQYFRAFNNSDDDIFSSWGFANVGLQFDGGTELSSSYFANPDSSYVQGFGRGIVDTANKDLLQGVLPKNGSILLLVMVRNGSLFTLNDDGTRVILNTASPDDLGPLLTYNAFASTDFASLKDVAEFTSLDFSKFSVDPVSHEKVWDVPYVQTKFDLDKLKTYLLANVDAEVSAKRFKDSAEVNAVANDQQMLANYIMKIFEGTEYNVFLKNVQVGNDWSVINSLLDPNQGFSDLRNPDLKAINPDKNQFQFNNLDIKAAFEQYLSDNNITLPYDISQVDLLDLFIYFGVFSFTSTRDASPVPGSFVVASFNSKPSKDVLDYNAQRLETDIAQKFTDYVYTIAEVLTRDYVQTTYLPDTTDLHNLPAYLSGGSESTTGFEYFLDPSSTAIWLDQQVTFDQVKNATEALSQLNFTNGASIFEDIAAEVAKLGDSARQVVKDAYDKYQEVFNWYQSALNSARLDLENIAKLATIAQAIHDGFELTKEKVAKLRHLGDIINANNKIISDADTEIATQDAILNDADATDKAKEDAQKAKDKAIQDKADAQGTLVGAMRNPDYQDALKRNADLQTISETQQSLANDGIVKAQASFTSNENKPFTDRYLRELRRVILEQAKSVNKLADARAYNEDFANTVIQNSYFGQVNKLNNGFFKDRWQKKIIDWELYDDNGDSISKVPALDENGNPQVDANGQPVLQDVTLRITDLDNVTPVKDRARAFWIYLLKSKGVGDRTLTGIYRDKDLDSNTMWGFVKNDLADKIKKLAFENKVTGEIKYLNVYTQNTNNLFYFKNQADESSRVTLHDEGYSSWVTESAVFAKYDNAFLVPDSSYRVFFTDANNVEVKGLSLGSRKSITENGKTAKQSPTKFTTDPDGSIHFDLIDQFNL